MFSLNEPTFAEIKEYLWTHHALPFSYDQVGATRTEDVPSGYQLDQHRVFLGTGRHCFLAAKNAIDEWRMFPSRFARLFWAGPIVPGKVVAVRFRALGVLWSLNPCRVVYSVDEITPRGNANVEIYGFAYGTLADHVEQGEERFTVSYRHDDESVWYEIFCFSRPSSLLAKLAYPYVRLMQSRFRHLSGLAMMDAVARPVAKTISAASTELARRAEAASI